MRLFRSKAATQASLSRHDVVNGFKWLLGRGITKRRLLLVGLPRGITSFVYQQVCRVTEFSSPEFVADGEVLNPERTDLNSPEINSELEETYNNKRTSQFFSKEKEAHRLFMQILTSIPNNYAIKDVVQPWFIIENINLIEELFFVIYLRRPIDQVQFALDRRGWNCYENIDEIDRFYSQLPTINVNSALFDSEYISLKLKSFGINAGGFDYIDDAFSARREQFFKDFYSSKSFSTTNLEQDLLEQAAWAYRTILGREPENEFVVKQLAGEGSLTKMRSALLRSIEFADLYSAIRPYGAR
jgi:hypothetical protein